MLVFASAATSRVFIARVNDRCRRDGVVVDAMLEEIGRGIRFGGHHCLCTIDNDRIAQLARRIQVFRGFIELNRERDWPGEMFDRFAPFREETIGFVNPIGRREFDSLVERYCEFCGHRFSVRFKNALESAREALGSSRAALDKTVSTPHERWSAIVAGEIAV